MLLFCSSSSGQNGGGHPTSHRALQLTQEIEFGAATNEITFDAFIIKRHNGTLYAKDYAKVVFCDSQQVLLTVTFPEAVIYLTGVLPTGAPHDRRGDWSSAAIRGEEF